MQSWKLLWIIIRFLTWKAVSIFILTRTWGLLQMAIYFKRLIYIMLKTINYTFNFEKLIFETADTQLGKQSGQSNCCLVGCFWLIDLMETKHCHCENMTCPAEFLSQDTWYNYSLVFRNFLHSTRSWKRSSSISETILQAEWKVSVSMSERFCVQRKRGCHLHRFRMESSAFLWR